ncbi:hypothetical protein IV203_006009 [Nitzschia inconspicua]|uniref:Uncharacterized protein n=1 Tax=Nitzschia inconspicua TaxID=303405 RepID=A0A9K3KNE2_9STRA|nr:hypothetical protein IV203_006009 [Nitzschia inconspicua]
MAPPKASSQPKRKPNRYGFQKNNSSESSTSTSRSAFSSSPSSSNDGTDSDATQPMSEVDYKSHSALATQSTQGKNPDDAIELSSDDDSILNSGPVVARQKGIKRAAPSSTGHLSHQNNKPQFVSLTDAMRKKLPPKKISQLSQSDHTCRPSSKSDCEGQGYCVTSSLHGNRIQTLKKRKIGAGKGLSAAMETLLQADKTSSVSSSSVSTMQDKVSPAKTLEKKVEHPKAEGRREEKAIQDTKVAVVQKQQEMNISKSSTETLDVEKKRLDRDTSEILQRNTLWKQYHDMKGRGDSDWVILRLYPYAIMKEIVDVYRNNSQNGESGC